MLDKKIEEHFKEKNNVPESGDIIFFDWDGNNSADHVGIVEKGDNGYVYTIEGKEISRLPL